MGFVVAACPAIARVKVSWHPGDRGRAPGVVLFDAALFPGGSVRDLLLHESFRNGHPANPCFS